MLRRVHELYGVSHPYFVPGAAQKANAAKSEAMSKRIAAGIPTNEWGRYQRGWYESTVNGRQWFASGWERLLMERLDQLKVTWTKNHHIRIPYTSGGQERNYVPDFLVSGNTLVEIKGYHRKDTALKHEAAERFCAARNWAFVVLTSVDDIRSWSPTSGKAQDAAKYGVEVIGIDEMWDRLGGKP